MRSLSSASRKHHAGPWPPYCTVRTGSSYQWTLLEVSMLRQVPPGWKVLKLLHLELFKHEDVGIFDDAYPMWITTIWLLGILYLKEGTFLFQYSASNRFGAGAYAIWELFSCCLIKVMYDVGFPCFVLVFVGSFLFALMIWALLMKLY